MSLDLSSAFSSLSGGHHIFSGGHAVGKVTEHGHIYDAFGHKLGSITHDGTMRDRAGHKVGRVGDDGKIYNKWSSHDQGFMHGNSIYDHSGHLVGSSSGGNLSGAAMLLLLNKKN